MRRSCSEPLTRGRTRGIMCEEGVPTMFRELINAWRKRDPLEDMYEKLIFMIEACEWMFDAAWQATVEGETAPQVKEDIYRRDVDVNRAERTIRKRIIEHLSVQPGVDVPACLVLMSVVKDAERLGDYCKNILEVAELEAEPLTSSSSYGSFEEIKKDVKQLFARTRTALADSDDVLAREVIAEERTLVRRCEALVERLASEDLPSRLGVPWALLARHLKRVSAHLGNLASSLVMPLHKLDYYDEKWLHGEPDDER